MNKITVIGTGSVGSTIAYTLAITGIASDIVMIDINGEKALGEALDIRQGTPFCNPCSIYAGNYSDAAGSDIVVITSGVARKPGQSRLDLAQVNVNILKSITPEITRYAPDATYVIVSNPVDVLTYAFCKYSGIPEQRIIGSGTILDTSRLRSRIAELGLEERVTLTGGLPHEQVLERMAKSDLFVLPSWGEGYGIV
ncbi:MAG: glycosyltransferase, partial [Acutalibacteraceae bacterium]|nr:glycosyltransferase [Acutalibacteraceae bacterium]